MRKLIIVILFISSACSNNNRIKNIEQIEDKIIIEKADLIKNNYRSVDLIEDYYFIPLETISMQNLIGKVDKIIFYRDRIFILDRKITKTIYIFSSSGKYINKICNIGNGPGEYKELQDFTINTNNDQIVLYCNKYRKLQYYDLESNYLYEDFLGLNLKSIEFFNNKFFIFTHAVYNYLDEYGELNYDLIETDTSGNILNYKFPSDAKLGIGITVITHNSYFTVGDNELYVSWVLSDTIYQINEEKLAIPFCYFDFDNKSIPKEVRKNKEQIELYKDVVMDGLYWSRYGELKYSNEKFITTISTGISNKTINNFHNVLFSKDLKTKKVFNKIEFDDDAMFNFPKTSYGDYFVSVIYPEEILANKEKHNDNTEIGLKGINTKINKFDNPILMFTKFK